jgi:hypothetical protein
MKRTLFIAAAASAACVSPLLAKAQSAPKRDWMRSCGFAVVWIDRSSGIYYYKGELKFGRTAHGAYTCEDEARKAGNRSSSF